MSSAPREQTVSVTAERLRERCRAVGLPVWRCLVDGTAVEHPTTRGLAGLWLRSGMVERLIGRTVRAWRGEDQGAPVRLFDGCWLLGMPERVAGRIAGYHVAMALSHEALYSEHFLAACSGAQLDAPATRHALEPLARHTGTSVGDLGRLMRWMAADLDELAGAGRSLSDFTDALTFSYETIDLLYALGRSMGRPERPDVFVRRALVSLQSVLDYYWIGAAFIDDDRMLPGVSGTAVLEQDARIDTYTVEKALRRMLGAHEDPEGGAIHESFPGAGSLGGPQVYCAPLTRNGRVVGVLAAGDKHGDDPQISTFDTGLIDAAACQISPFLETTALYAEQHAMFMGTLSALTSAIDAKDPYTCGHSARVAYLAAALAQKVGLDGGTVERVHIAGLVHDVGKIGVPEAVLGKAGRLTDEEFERIKQHPAIGNKILQGIPALRDVLPGVLYHHERWDGKGYPTGRAGEDIPLFARLIGIADTFDAMSSSRSYRAAMEREKVLAEIRRCAGSQFDPRLVEPFLQIDLGEYDNMLRSARGPDYGLNEAA